jgi:hypothetical protein
MAEDNASCPLVPHGLDGVQQCQDEQDNQDQHQQSAGPVGMASVPASASIPEAAAK